MFAGRILYVFGIIVVIFSSLYLVLAIFDGDTYLVPPILVLLNAFIAIGVGDLVINLHNKKRNDNKKILDKWVGEILEQGTAPVQ